MPGRNLHTAGGKTHQKKEEKTVHYAHTGLGLVSVSTSQTGNLVIYEELDYSFRLSIALLLVNLKEISRKIKGFPEPNYVPEQS